MNHTTRCSLNRSGSAEPRRGAGVHPSEPAAFTLIEVLVATAITLALAGVALLIVVNSLGLWHRIEGNLSQAVQARAIFDQLERDLPAALGRDGSGTWLAVELQDSATQLRDSHGWLVDGSGGGRIKPGTSVSLDADASSHGGGIIRARFALGGAWLRFFSLGSSGLPEAVSYQIVRRPVTGEASLANPGAPHYFLVRSTAGDLLERGLDITTGYDDVIAAPGAVDALADGVVDFGIWLQVRDPAAPGGWRRIFPANATDTGVHAAVGDLAGGSGDESPEAVDVMVRILSAEGATLLANLESGRGRAQPATDEEWWALVEAHSVVFVQRIELKGAGR